MSPAPPWPDRPRGQGLARVPRRVLRRLEALLPSLLVLASCLAPASAGAVDSVRAQLGQASAWTGEGVPLVITLYSRGPFASAPVFDLPQLPRSAIVRTGSPLVGSEDVEGESYFTQRHEFVVYTQSTGEIVLPPIHVRFEAKPSLEGADQSVEGRTAELRFTSRRPPGTEALGAVVATSGMEIVQEWTPAEPGRLEPGDVIERKVTQRAARTTAMMLPEPAARAAAGVRIYPGRPVVRDHLERGEFTAERTDTFKYQFERAGRYELAPLSFTWWDPGTQSLRQQVLEGREVRVGGALSSLVPAAVRSWPPVLRFGILAFLAVLGGGAVAGLRSRWRARRHDPERRAARELEAACRANDARAAYSALLHWKSIVMRRDPAARLAGAAAMPEASALRDEANALAARNFSPKQADLGWDGSGLRSVFVRLRRRLRRSVRTGTSARGLPPLNP